MDARSVIIRPVVSEKSYDLIEGNVYTFVVHNDANKTQIRQAIEQIFGVRVVKVNTLNRKGKRMRSRRTHLCTMWRAARVLASGTPLPCARRN